MSLRKLLEVVIVILVKQKELNNLNIIVNRIDVKLDNLLNDLTNDYNMTYEFAINNYKLDMDIDSANKGD